MWGVYGWVRVVLQVGCLLQQRGVSASAGGWVGDGGALWCLEEHGSGGGGQSAGLQLLLAVRQTHEARAGGVGGQGAKAGAPNRSGGSGV